MAGLGGRCSETGMDRKAFQEQLARTGSYDTASDGNPRSRCERMLGWSDGYYYWRIFRVVYSGHCYSKRGQFGVETWADHSYGIHRAVEACGGRIIIDGMDLVAALGVRPVVYVGNHMSLLETLLIPVMALQFNYLATVVKESLVKYPIFGTVMRAVEPVTVSRRNPREDLKMVLEKGKEFLGAGRSVLIFPQSTRSRTIDPADFNSLGAKLAQRSNVPLVPVAVKTDFHGIGRWARDVGRIDRKKALHFRFGAPMDVEGNGREAHRKTVDFITGALAEWGCQVETEQ